jgi:hypothetical protein
MSLVVKGFGCRPPELVAPSGAAGTRNPSQMQLVAAHVLESRRIGRSPNKRGEVLDPLHVVLLGLRRSLADRHVFDHALPQRAYGLIGHGGCSCLDGGCEPLISTQDAPWRYPLGCAASRGALPRERFSPLTRKRTSPPFMRPPGHAISSLVSRDMSFRHGSWSINGPAGIAAAAVSGSPTL